MNAIEQQPIDPALLAGLGEIQTLKSVCYYMKGFDWLIFLTRDCSTTEERTADPQIERLVDNVNGEIVGFKILNFKHYPHKNLDRVLEAAGLDFDNIKDIEHLWIENALEQDAEFSASEVEFFAELRRRAALGLG